MASILQFTGSTTLDLDADALLENTKGELKHFVIIGWTHDDELYFSSTSGNVPRIIHLLRRGEKFVLEWECENE